MVYIGYTKSMRQSYVQQEPCQDEVRLSLCFAPDESTGQFQMTATAIQAISGIASNIGSIAATCFRREHCALSTIQAFPMLRIHGQGSHRPNLVNHLRYDKSLAIDAHVQAPSVRKGRSWSTSNWPSLDIHVEMARMRSLICGVLATLTSYE
jgi:hypothetical protein